VSKSTEKRLPDLTVFKSLEISLEPGRFFSDFPTKKDGGASQCAKS